MSASAIRNLMQEKLTSGIAELKLDISAAKIQKLLDFCELLIKWNRVYNLTAITEPEKIISHHILDSLAVSRYLDPATNILDIGTGAGLPGIPLALICSEKNFVLLDSNAKKLSFVQSALTELGLKNAKVMHARIENYQNPQINGVITRAFANLNELISKAGHLLSPQTYLFAMIGKLAVAETEILAPDYELLETIELQVPQLAAERHLLVIRRRQDGQD